VPERLFGRQIPVDGGVNITFAEPLGVVGVIVPWNFPMPIAGWGFAPALAAGNTVVLKPAEITPLTAIRIGELALEAGLPEGVLQIIPGKGSVVGERFVTHAAVRKVVFTGSTEVGKRIMAGCAAQVKNLTLELGGKNANIVFDDADVTAAAAAAPAGVFDNSGQDCCARSRILVHDSGSTTDFMERTRILAVAGVLRLCGSEPRGHADMGPLVISQGSPREASPAMWLDGAEVAFTGNAPERRRASGFRRRSCSPRRITATAASSREEIFGPVRLRAVPFDDRNGRPAPSPTIHRVRTLRFDLDE
jgi:acyl-CoA reductase-like NAD-dependent aldehyde dehydrogenase